MADVRYVMPGGTDTPLATNPAAGSSIPLAWATIQFSLDQMITLPAGKKELRLVGGPGGTGWKENIQMKGAKYSDITICGWTTLGAVTIQDHKDYDWGGFCEGRPPVDGAKKASVFTIEDATGIVLQDVQIVNGKADLGAGVHATKSQVDLIKCCIHDNEATPHTGSGGGFAFDHCNLHGLTSKIDGCVVFNNKAGKDGGGGWIKDNEGKVTVTATEFQDNGADEDGGGLALIDCREIEILKHCLFGGGGHKNSGKNGGAIAVSANVRPITIGDPTATAAAGKNKIEDNVATTAGGGIRIVKGRASVIVGGTDIKTNHATAGANTADGGGIAIQQFELSDRPTAQAVQDARLQLQQNTAIDHNDADQFGGGVFATIGTAVEIADADVATVEITGNKAEHGGGIYASVHSGVSATGGEIKDNTARASGGGAFVSNGWLDLTGTTVEQNKALRGPGGGGYVETRYSLDPNERNFVLALTKTPLAVGRVNIRNGATPGSGTLSNNSAGGGLVAEGGGLACDGDVAKRFPLDVTVHGITVSLNKAMRGGGLDLMNTRTATIDGNCSFYQNTASADGGGVFVHAATGLSIADNTQGFVENKAGTGAGFALSKCEISATTVRGNTFNGNTLGAARGAGRDGAFEQCTFNPAGLTTDTIEKDNMPAGASQPSFIKR